MSITASELLAIVAVRGADEAAAQLLRVGSASDIAGGSLKALAAGALLIAGVAIAGIGIASIKMAGDFQQGLTRLKTGAGDVTDNLATLGQGILKVSVATGILTSGTDGLNAAMYKIISSGQRGAQSLNTLTAAAQGAQIEQANVVDVTQILTTLQKNFGLATYTAAQYMDGLITAVAHGNITLEALSTAMSPILPQAHELGIHFADVAAAMSDMTLRGIPADQAATALRFTFQSMILPTKASQKAMQEWGLDSAKVAEVMKTSLPDALQMYIDAAKRAGPEGSKPFIDALSQMMGGGQRAAKALFSLSQSMGDWRTMIGQVDTAMGDMGVNVAGWDTVQGNLNLQLDKGKAAVQALFIGIGMQLLPIVTKIMGAINPVLGGFAKWASDSKGLGSAFSGLAPIGQTISSVFNGIVSAIQSPEFQTLANTLNGVFASALQKVSGLLSGPFKTGMDTLSGLKSSDVSLALRQAAAAINIFVEALQGTQDGASQFVAAGTSVRDTAFQVWGVMQQVGTYLYNTFLPVWTQLQTTIQQQVIPAWQDLVNSVRPLMPTLEWIAQDIGVVVVGALWLWMQVLSKVWQFIIQAFGGIVQVISGALQLLAGGIAIFADFFSGHFEKMGTDVQSVFNGIVDMIKGALNFINSLSGGALAALAKIFGLNFGKITASSGDMSKNVSKSASTMDKNVQGSFSDMSQNSLTSVQTLSDGAIGLLQQLGDNGSAIMQHMDQAATAYWNHVSDLINQWETKVQISQMTGAQRHQYYKGQDLTGGNAEGTDYWRGGVSLVGEKGPELVYLPRGAQVIPNNRINNTSINNTSMTSGGGSNQPIVVYVQLGEHQFGPLMADMVGNAMMRKANLQYGRKVY